MQEYLFDYKERWAGKRLIFSQSRNQNPNSISNSIMIKS